MRKTVIGLLALCALAVGTSALIAPVQAGFSICTYRCICSVPHKCCGTACKPAPDGPLQCPQVQNC